MPSSLTILLPSALGFSPHPPVSVYGTGTYGTIAAFLGSRSACFATLVRSTSQQGLSCADLPAHHPLCLYQSFHSWLMLSFCVPTVLTQPVRMLRYSSSLHITARTFVCGFASTPSPLLVPVFPFLAHAFLLRPHSSDPAGPHASLL